LITNRVSLYEGYVVLGILAGALPVYGAGFTALSIAASGGGGVPYQENCWFLAFSTSEDVLDSVALKQIVRGRI